MECPICYEEYGHAPHCPVAMENEVDEYDRERKQALKTLKRANKACSGRLVRPAKKTVSKSTNGSAKVAGSPSRR